MTDSGNETDGRVICPTVQVQKRHKTDPIKRPLSFSFIPKALQSLSMANSRVTTRRDEEFQA